MVVRKKFSYSVKFDFVRFTRKRQQQTIQFHSWHDDDTSSTKLNCCNACTLEPKAWTYYAVIYIHNVDFMLDVNIYCDCCCRCRCRCVCASCVPMWVFGLYDWVVDKEYIIRSNTWNINIPTTGIFQTTHTHTPYMHASEISKRAKENGWCVKRNFQSTKGNCLFHTHTSIERYSLPCVWIWERGCSIQLWPLPLDMCEQNRHSIDTNVGRSPFSVSLW